MRIPEPNPQQPLAAPHLPYFRTVRSTFVSFMSLVYRSRFCVSAIVLIPIGYWVRFYGFGPDWIADALGSIVYEMFWISLGLAFWPKSPFKVSGSVFLLTCGLEFLQLWQPPLLQSLRATLPGRLILGNTFSGSDFPAYGVGSSLGYVWVKFLARQKHRR
jgi:Protein of unknown function (DUF2809)